MRKNQGFAHTLLPVLLLLVGLGVSLVLVNQRTGFLNRAIGIPTSIPNPSPWGNAVELDGNLESRLSYVMVSNKYLPNFILGDNFTIEAWVKIASNAGGIHHHTIMGTNTPRAQSPVVHLYTYDIHGAYTGDNTAWFSITGSDNTIYKIEGTTKLIPDQWNHIAGVRAKNQLTLYVNGRPDGVPILVNSPTKSLDQDLLIGAYAYNNSFGSLWNGQIEEVRISNAARYISSFDPSRLPFSVDSSTLALWHFDEGRGSTHAIESSGHLAPALYVNASLVPSTVPTNLIAHRGCLNNACAWIEGSGINQCYVDIDCAPKPTHKECRNWACTTVDGTGSDTCQQNLECMPIITHAECRNEACVKVVGIGQDTCQSNLNCTPPPSCKIYVYNAASNTVPPFSYTTPLSGGATLYSGKYYLYGLEVKNNSTASALTNIKVSISKKAGVNELVKITQVDKNCTADYVNKTVSCSPINTINPSQTLFVGAGHIVQIQPITTVSSTTPTTTTLYSMSTNLGTANCAFAWKIAPSVPQPTPL